jgi:hypothetical protein
MLNLLKMCPKLEASRSNSSCVHILYRKQQREDRGFCSEAAVHSEKNALDCRLWLYGKQKWWLTVIPDVKNSNVLTSGIPFLDIKNWEFLISKLLALNITLGKCCVILDIMNGSWSLFWPSILPSPLCPKGYSCRLMCAVYALEALNAVWHPGTITKFGAPSLHFPPFLVYFFALYVPLLSYPSFHLFPSDPSRYISLSSTVIPSHPSRSMPLFNGVPDVRIS